MSDSLAIGRCSYATCTSTCDLMLFSPFPCLITAQDVGAHRWQTFGNEESAERERWTRAWWYELLWQHFCDRYYVICAAGA